MLASVFVRVFLRMLVIGAQDQLFRATPAFLLQIGEQSLVRQVKRVRVLPIVLGDLVQPRHHVVVIDFDGQLAPIVEAARREIDRADDGAQSVGQ